MYIESVPNRNSPPAILLSESYREHGRVRKRTLCNLSDWPVAHIEGLRGVLRGGTVIAAECDAFSVLRTLPHGHVAAALGTARKIGSIVSSARMVIAAATSFLRFWSAGSSILHPSSRPRVRCLPPRRPQVWARCSASVRSTKTSSTSRWTGC